MPDDGQRDGIKFVDAFATSVGNNIDLLATRQVDSIAITVGIIQRESNATAWALDPAMSVRSHVKCNNCVCYVGKPLFFHLAAG